GEFEHGVVHVAEHRGQGDQARGHLEHGHTRLRDDRHGAAVRAQIVRGTVGQHNYPRGLDRLFPVDRHFHFRVDHQTRSARGSHATFSLPLTVSLSSQFIPWPFPSWIFTKCSYPFGSSFWSLSSCSPYSRPTLLRLYAESSAPTCRANGTLRSESIETPLGWP